MKALRLLHTLRYLKPVQIWGRLSFAVKRKFFRPIIVASVKRQKISLPGKAFSLLLPKCYPQSSVQNLSERRFVFLHVPADYHAGIRWNDGSKSKLWLYNLHYFEYLLPLTHEVGENNFNPARSIIQDWLRNNPVGYGNGWEPYPISLRTVNWIFFYVAYRKFFRDDPAFEQNFLKSLYRQIAYLNHFPEFHLLANHLWANIKALLFGGIFFAQPHWLDKGARLFLREADEQILADGGHFERSPMYHALILTDLIDLANLLQNSLPGEAAEFPHAQMLKEKVHARIPEMLRWLETMTHPDGEPALFGDTAFDIAPSLQEIKKYAQAVLKTDFSETPVFATVSLKDSGYYVKRTERFYLVIDGGELGVSYQPGHAHCDLLSYELSYKGLRFVVDSGVGEYLPTELRRKARSIYGHNTLVVNGLEQAEIWSAFRMGRRVHPEKAECKSEPVFTFQGAYSNRLKRKLAYRHQRRIEVRDTVNITDQWQAASVKSVENLIHLHPQCTVKAGPGYVQAERDGVGMRIVFSAHHVKAEIRDWFYVPEFGRVLAAKVLVLMPRASLSEMSYAIQGL